MTSRSGTIATTIRAKRTFHQGKSLGATCVNVPPTNACVNTVGNFIFPPNLLNSSGPIPFLDKPFLLDHNEYLKLCNKFNVFVKRTRERTLTLTFARQCPILDFTIHVIRGESLWNL